MKPYALILALWIALAPENSEATALKEPIAKSAASLAKTTTTAKIPKWKIEKMQLERQREQAMPFIGKYMRNADGEFFEFYFSKNGKLKGVAEGIGEYNYRFALTDIELLDGEQIRFKLKGKLYTARLIDDALVVTYHDGIKKYHPRVKEPLISKR
jgi:hypothetical protein